MVTYKISEENSENITYNYFPNGKDDKGFLTINKKDGSIINYSIAKTDEFKRYFFHFRDKIKEFILKQNFPNEGFVAWY